MKQRAITLIQSLRFKANGKKRRLLLLVLAILLSPADRAGCRSWRHSDFDQDHHQHHPGSDWRRTGRDSGAPQHGQQFSPAHHLAARPAQPNQRICHLHPNAIRQTDVPDPGNQQRQRHASKPITAGIARSKWAIGSNRPTSAALQKCLWQRSLSD